MLEESNIPQPTKEGIKRNEEELISGKVCPLVYPYFVKDSDKSVQELRNISKKTQNSDNLDIEIDKVREEIIKGKRNEYTQAIKTELAEKSSRTDKLTGLFNRAYFDEQIRKDFDRAKRYGDNFSLLLFDIDRFKLVNDTLGHDAGDTVLKELAKLLRKESDKVLLRESDMAFRYGGEEFTITLPKTGSHNAKEVAERVRIRVEEEIKPLVKRLLIKQLKEKSQKEKFIFLFEKFKKNKLREDAKDEKLINKDELTAETFAELTDKEKKKIHEIVDYYLTGTISTGVESYKDHDSVEDLIKQADKALYFAKASGRNNVRTASELKKELSKQKKAMKTDLSS